LYDVIVVGGGHAGVEAALAAARMNMNTVLVTGNLNRVASLPCNPSIGGPAKGVVVREIDALGGQMGITTDLASIQMRLLNTSKGPAVRALRAQVDKIEYPKLILETLKAQKNLTLIEEMVDTIFIEDNKVKGVFLDDGTVIEGKSVVITTGTYLGSAILIGHDSFVSGPDGAKTTFGISGQLRDLGFEMLRLKTGTPPRIKKSSIDFTKMIEQPGDDLLQNFSFDSPVKQERSQVSCYLTRTNDKTHQIINLNLHESSMYSRDDAGTGARYCPSIEDKVVRFSTQPSHQIFVEPESIHLDEMYIQGLSTSMPKHIQEEMVKSVVGLENAEIVKYAYAIEYDAINPVSLFPTLETKMISGLYCAGQINGTSGYEEAACQGLIAGINAALKVLGKSPLVIRRDQAYIGVLIDDLVTKGTKEPYRLLTSRAENRMLLRHDNADLRLTQIGYEIGLINEERYQVFKTKEAQIKELSDLIHKEYLTPTENTQKLLSTLNVKPLKDKTTIAKLMERPELGSRELKVLAPTKFSDEIYEQVVIKTKYKVYIDEAFAQAEKMLVLEDKEIPSAINYYGIHNLSSEAKEKLTKVQPRTIAQAKRIPGVNQTDISILLVFMRTVYDRANN